MRPILADAITWAFELPKRSNDPALIQIKNFHFPQLKRASIMSQICDIMLSANRLDSLTIAIPAIVVFVRFTVVSTALPNRRAGKGKKYG
jgi:hypothetical protein